MSCIFSLLLPTSLSALTPHKPNRKPVHMRVQNVIAWRCGVLRQRRSAMAISVHSPLRACLTALLTLASTDPAARALMASPGWGLRARAALLVSPAAVALRSACSGQYGHIARQVRHDAEAPGATRAAGLLTCAAVCPSLLQAAPSMLLPPAAHRGTGLAAGHRPRSRRAAPLPLQRRQRRRRMRARTRMSAIFSARRR